MKPLNKFKDEYFKKYDDGPVKLMPYSSEMTALANKYIKIVNQIAKGIDIEAKIIGSVAYKIPTADVEIAIYINKENWMKVLQLLEKRFGKPVYSEEQFALFPIGGEKFDFDIHLYTGYEGIVSKKLTEFMLGRPGLINNYRQIKLKYSYSKREYQYNKNKFLTGIIKQIPY